MSCLPTYKGKRYNSIKELKAEYNKYNGEPSLYDAKNKTAYLIKGKADKTSAIHEIFTHPFLIQIEQTNPKLYNNLLTEAKSNKDIVSYVDNNYKNNEFNSKILTGFHWYDFDGNTYTKEDFNTKIKQYDKIKPNNILKIEYNQKNTPAGDMFNVFYVNTYKAKQVLAKYNINKTVKEFIKDSQNKTLIGNEKLAINELYKSQNNSSSPSQHTLDHEYIARAIDLYAKSELNAEKDKGLINKVKEVWNSLVNHLKKLFNIPEVYSNAITPNITLRQLTQFAMYSKGKLDLNLSENEITKTLKSIDILNNLSTKQQQEFNRLAKGKISIEDLVNKLQIPKEQKQLVIDSYNEGNTTSEELALDLASKYSFAVEIKTATRGESDYNMVDVTGNGDFEPEPFIPDTEFREVTDDEGNVIRVEEVLSEKGKKQLEKPTQEHINLSARDFNNN